MRPYASMDGGGFDLVCSRPFVKFVPHPQVLRVEPLDDGPSTQPDSLVWQVRVPLLGAWGRLRVPVRRSREELSVQASGDVCCRDRVRAWSRRVSDLRSLHV